MWTITESAMPSSGQSTPKPEHCVREAKKLLKDIKAGYTPAFLRVRSVYLDTRDIPDSEVPKIVGLQRCQHVIAKEYGHECWAELKHAWEQQFQIHPWMSAIDGSHYEVQAFQQHAVIKDLSALIEMKKAPPIVRRMMADLTSFFMGYSAIVTRDECRHFFAWSFNVLSISADVQIDQNGTIHMHGYAFKLKPIAAEEYNRIREEIENYPGDEWMVGMDE